MVSASERFSRGPEGLITARIRQRDNFERESNARMEALALENEAQRQRIGELEQPPEPELPPEEPPQEPISILSASVQQQSTGPITLPYKAGLKVVEPGQRVYEVYGINRATRAHGREEETIAVFSSKEEAEAFKRKNSSSDKVFYDRFGYDGGDVREVTADYNSFDKKVTSGTAGSRSRSSDNKALIARRQSGITFEMDKQLANLEKAKQQGQISERSYQELKSNIVNAPELERYAQYRRDARAQLPQVTSMIEKGIADGQTAGQIIKTVRGLPEAYQNYGTLGATAVYAGQVRDVNAYNQTLRENTANTYSAVGRQAQIDLNRDKVLSGVNDTIRDRGIVGQNYLGSPSSLGGISSEALVRQAQERERLEEQGSILRGGVEPVLSIVRGAVKLSRATSPVLDYGFQVVGKDEVLKPISPIYRDPDVQLLGLGAGLIATGYYAPTLISVGLPYLTALGTKRAVENPTRFTIGEAATNVFLPFLPEGINQGRNLVRDNIIPPSTQSQTIILNKKLPENFEPYYKVDFTEKTIASAKRTPEGNIVLTRTDYKPTLTSIQAIGPRIGASELVTAATPVLAPIASIVTPKAAAVPFFAVAGKVKSGKSPMSKAELRKQSFNAQQQRTFTNPAQGEVGMRITTPELKSRGVSEQIIAANQKGQIRITEMGFSPSRGGLTTTAPRDSVQQVNALVVRQTQQREPKQQAPTPLDFLGSREVQPRQVGKETYGTFFDFKEGSKSFVEKGTKQTKERLQGGSGTQALTEYRRQVDNFNDLLQGKTRVVDYRSVNIPQFQQEVGIGKIEYTNPIINIQSSKSIRGITDKVKFKAPKNNPKDINLIQRNIVDKSTIELFKFFGRTEKGEVPENRLVTRPIQFFPEAPRVYKQSDVFAGDIIFKGPETKIPVMNKPHGGFRGGKYSRQSYLNRLGDKYLSGLNEKGTEYYNPANDDIEYLRGFQPLNPSARYENVRNIKNELASRGATAVGPATRFYTGTTRRLGVQERLLLGSNQAVGSHQGIIPLLGLGVNQRIEVATATRQDVGQIQSQDLRIAQAQTLDTFQITAQDQQQDMVFDTPLITTLTTPSTPKTPSSPNDTFFPREPTRRQPPRTPPERPPRRTPPRTPPPTIIRVPPTTQQPKSIMFGEEEGSGQAYNVYVKTKQLKLAKGKYKSQGYTKANDQPLDRESALGMGAEIVDKYTNRSFKIEKTAGRAERVQALAAKLSLLQRFRASKSKPNVYVEQSAFAISSQEEKDGIPYESIRQKKGRTSSVSNSFIGGKSGQSSSFATSRKSSGSSSRKKRVRFL